MFPKIILNKENLMNYKRLIFAGMAVVLICSFAMAQEEDGGIGLTPKLEVGFGNVAEEAEISLSPGVEYEKSFGNLDVFAELDYLLTLADPDATHDIYLEVELGYNLSFGEASVLSFIVNNTNEYFRLSPELAAGETHEGTLEPSILFTQTLGFGDLYAQAGFPIEYLTGEKDADPNIGAYLTLGWASTFGLGVELTPNLALSPESDYAGFDILVGYANGPIYAEVEVNLPKEIDVEGITITPEFDYSFNAFTFYVSSEFGAIGVDGGDISVSPAIGVKYSF
jgi:hypothetical protein